MSKRQDPQMDFHVSLIDQSLHKAMRSLERAQAKVDKLNQAIDKLDRQRTKRLADVSNTPELFTPND